MGAAKKTNPTIVNARNISPESRARRLSTPAGGQMESSNAIMRLTDQPALDAIAEPLRDVVHRVYDSAGLGGRPLRTRCTAFGLDTRFIRCSQTSRSARGRPASYWTLLPPPTETPRCRTR